MTSNAAQVCAAVGATLVVSGIIISAAAIYKCGPSSQEITDIKWKENGFTYYTEDGVRRKVKFR